MINFTSPSNNLPPQDQWKSKESLEARESGVAPFPVPPLQSDLRSQLPPNAGQWPVPAYQQVVGLINQTFRAHFPIAGDEAIRYGREFAKACWRDPICWAPLNERILPVSQLAWALEPQDETDPEQIRAAAKNTMAAALTPRFQQRLMLLEHACWFGKAAVCDTYKWNPNQPDLLNVVDWFPVHGDSLVPRWSGGSVGGDWGVLVNSQFKGPYDNYNLGRVHWIDPEERESYVIHIHQPEPFDYFEVVDTGSIKGVGLRSKVFWAWFLRANLLAAALDFAERVGSGIWLAGYDKSNPNGKQDMIDAVAQYKENRAIFRPMTEDGRTAYDLRILEPGSVSIGLLENLIRYFDNIIRATILGHPIGGGAEINVGGDTAAMYSDAVSRTTRYDAVNLAETLSNEWVPTLYRYNSRNVPPARFRFSVEHSAASTLLQYGKALMDMGYAVDLDHIANVCGIPKAAMNAAIGTNVQSVNPVAVQSPPEGVPVAGNSPPQPEPQAAPQPTPVN